MAVEPIRGPASRLAANEQASALYECYARAIFAHCLSRLGDRLDAEDAMQATFLNAYRGFRRGVMPELELAWLFAIANRVILNHRRAAARRRAVEAPHDLSELQDVLATPAGEHLDLVRLRRALDAMPASQREAFLLREWRGLSCREIAKDLSLSVGATEQLLFRARRTLQHELTKPDAGRSRLRGLDIGTAIVQIKSLLGLGTAAKLAAVATAVLVLPGGPAPEHRSTPPTSIASVRPAEPSRVQTGVPAVPPAPQRHVARRLLAPPSAAVVPAPSAAAAPLPAASSPAVPDMPAAPQAAPAAPAAPPATTPGQPTPLPAQLAPPPTEVTPPAASTADGAAAGGSVDESARTVQSAVVRPELSAQALVALAIHAAATPAAPSLAGPPSDPGPPIDLPAPAEAVATPVRDGGGQGAAPSIDAGPPVDLPAPAADAATTLPDAVGPDVTASVGPAAVALAPDVVAAQPAPDAPGGAEPTSDSVFPPAAQPDAPGLVGAPTPNDTTVAAPSVDITDVAAAAAAAPPPPPLPPPPPPPPQPPAAQASTPVAAADASSHAAKKSR